MNCFRKIVDILVVDIAIHALVGINLGLAVGNDVGNDDLVVDDEADIPRKDLIAIGDK